MEHLKNQIIMKTGEDPICVVTADFNSDNGYLDLAVLNYRDQSIYYLSQFFDLVSFRKTIGGHLKPGKIPINMDDRVISIGDGI